MWSQTTSLQDKEITEKQILYSMNKVPSSNQTSSKFLNNAR